MRAARLITEHLPIAEFRERFDLEGCMHCICGLPDTREHMLNMCSVWIRTWKPGAPPTPVEIDFLEGLNPVDQHTVLFLFNCESIRDFLLLNPMARTFE